MVFRFLFIVCAFPVWGGQEYPVPPSVCLLERVSFLFLFYAGVGEGTCFIVGGGMAWGGGGGGGLLV